MDVNLPVTAFYIMRKFSCHEGFGEKTVLAWQKQRRSTLAFLFVISICFRIMMLVLLLRNSGKVAQMFLCLLSRDRVLSAWKHVYLGKENNGFEESCVSTGGRNWWSDVNRHLSRWLSALSSWVKMEVLTQRGSGTVCVKRH